MQRRPDPTDEERTLQRRQRPAPATPKDGANGAAHEWAHAPVNGHGIPNTPVAPVAARTADGPDETPPWERESARIPAVWQIGDGAAGAGVGGAASGVWEWGAAVEQSMPGVGIGDMTGTGKIPAVAPLAPHESWSRGIRPPRAQPGGEASAGGAGVSAAVVRRDGRSIEVEDQPSAQLRAMRVGNLARATAIVTVALLLSRVLGLARTSLFAYTFGSSSDADAFTYAFSLPDAIFSIVSGGALASAFIPVFAEYLIDKRDKRTAWHIASAALNLSVVALTLLAIVAAIFTPQFLNLTLHPLFVAKPAEAEEVVRLTRIMLLQPIFLGGATITVGILQARQHFVLPAIGQVIYTASLVGGILATLVDNRYHVFGGHLGIAGPTWGVVVGAALQFVIQIPGLGQAKMEYAPTLDLSHPGVREMFRLMAPRLVNSVFLYIAVFINRGLLSSVDVTGAVYGYVTAFTLVMLPVGVFGMAVSQAAFPTLAALVAVGDWKRLRETIMTTLRGVTYLGVPSSLGLIVLAEPISTLLLSHGHFHPAQLPLIYEPLIFFAVGLLGLSLVEILTRSFYALHDSRTAVEVSVLQFLFVIGLSVALLPYMGANGLALATALGSNGEALVLLLLLRTRLGGLDLRPFWRYSLNVLAASTVCALTALLVYTLSKVALPVQETSPVETVKMAVRVTVSIVVAGGVYLLFSRFLGIDDAVSLNRIVGRLRRRRS